jgi:acetyltransferase-like isoleucine patch superfamily enzyme
MDNYANEQKRRLWILTLFGSKWFSFPITFNFRIKAYQKHFNIGLNPIIEHNVWIKRTHSLPGNIKIGDRVLLARNCSIDYSGSVVIEDDVWISEGVQIHSHIHQLTKDRVKRNGGIITTEIILRNGCWIGNHAIILPQTKEIGENSIIAAGSVVTKLVPPNTVVAGNPAKIIKYLDFDKE